MRKLLLASVFLASMAQAQILGPIFQKPTAGGTAAYTTQYSNFTCYAANCAIGTQTYTAGNAILACGIWQSISGTGVNLSSVTDGGDTFTISAASRQSSPSANYAELGVQCGYVLSTAGGSRDVSCNFTGTHDYSACIVYELNNVAALDQVAVGTGTTNSIATSGVTTSDADIAVTVFSIDDNTGSWNAVAGTNWTMGTTYAAGNIQQSSERQKQSAAGSLAGTATFTNRAAQRWVATMVTFK